MLRFSLSHSRGASNACELLIRLGAAVGSLGSTYSTCPAQAKVFQLESRQDYELFVGVGISGEQLVCGFGMYHLMTFGKSPMVVPFPLDATDAPQALCKN